MSPQTIFYKRWHIFGLSVANGSAFVTPSTYHF